MAAAYKSTIFKGTEVYSHLEALYKSGSADWYKVAINFAFGQVRATTKGSSTIRWINVFYTNSQGVKGPMVIRVHGETHVGAIRPNTDSAVTEINAAAKNPAFLIEKRPGNPSIQVQKWNAKVETEADGLTLLTDASGNPILPGDDKRSPMFGVMDLVSKAFATECGERAARGEALAAACRVKGATAAAVAAAHPAAGAFLTPEQVTAIRKAFPAKADTDALTAGAIIGKLTVICPVQEAISANAKRNAGQLLPNPLARASLKFNQATGLPDKLQIFDMNKSSAVGARVVYEEATVDGEPVHADNVHKFVLPRSTFDGIVKMDSICFSQMGVSMPMSFNVIVIRQPATATSSGLDDLYEDMEMTPPAAPAAAAASAASASAAASAAPAPLRAAAAAPDDDYDSLLEDLGGDE